MSLITTDDISGEGVNALESRLRTYLATMYDEADGDISSYTRAQLKKKTWSALIASAYGKNTKVNINCNSLNIKI